MIVFSIAQRIAASCRTSCAVFSFPWYSKYRILFWAFCVNFHAFSQPQTLRQPIEINLPDTAAGILSVATGQAYKKIRLTPVAKKDAFGNYMTYDYLKNEVEIFDGAKVSTIRTEVKSNVSISKNQRYFTIARESPNDTDGSRWFDVELRDLYNYVVCSGRIKGLEWDEGFDKFRPLEDGSGLLQIGDMMSLDLGIAYYLNEPSQKAFKKVFSKEDTESANSRVALSSTQNMILVSYTKRMNAPRTNIIECLDMEGNLKWAKALPDESAASELSIADEDGKIAFVCGNFATKENDNKLHIWDKYGNRLFEQEVSNGYEFPSRFQKYSGTGYFIAPSMDSCIYFINMSDKKVKNTPYAGDKESRLSDGIIAFNCFISTYFKGMSVRNTSTNTGEYKSKENGLQIESFFNRKATVILPLKGFLMHIFEYDNKLWLVERPETDDYIHLNYYNLSFE